MPHGDLPRMIEANERPNESQTVPCKWCGTPTPMLATKMCNGCWELESRIGAQPELARRMLAALDR